MVYSFCFEGGAMDGEVVLTDYAEPVNSTPQSAAWLDLTLGGVVGLSFPVLNPKPERILLKDGHNQAGKHEDCGQLYQVVYRDEHAGNVLIRCRYIQSVELVPVGTRRVEFTFEGGFMNGETDGWTVMRSDEQRDSDSARARFRMTDSGTVGKRFGVGSAAALQMLKDEGPAATRGAGVALDIYEVASRTQDGANLRLHCRFIRSECTAGC
jgi:hypothetical protein